MADYCLKIVSNMGNWLRKRTLELISKYNVRLKKKLSQSFLVNDFIVNSLINFLELSPTDTVIDVGAGLGLITKLIAEKVRKVIAIEIDPILAKILRDVTSDLGNVEVIESDVMKFSLPKVDKIFSNVPYGISSLLIIKLLKERCFKIAILTLQKEFGLRMTAKPGTSNYGRLSVIVSLYGNVKKLMIINRRNFYPVPKVDSIAIRLEPLDGAPLELINKIEDITAKLFSQRRRVVRKVIEKFYNKIPDKIPPSIINKRVYELTPSEILKLASSLSDNISPYIAAS